MEMKQKKLMDLPTMIICHQPNVKQSLMSKYSFKVNPFYFMPYGKNGDLFSKKINSTLWTLFDEISYNFMEDFQLLASFGSDEIESMASVKSKTELLQIELKQPKTFVILWVKILLDFLNFMFSFDILQPNIL